MSKSIKVKGIPAAAKKNIIELVDPLSLTFEKSNACKFNEKFVFWRVFINCSSSNPTPVSGFS